MSVVKEPISFFHFNEAHEKISLRGNRFARCAEMVVVHFGC